MAPKMKSRQKASQEYWEEREKEALKQTRLTEEQFAAEIEKIYADMRREVNSRISNWYVRYADESGIDIAEAKKRVSKLDMEEYAELARKYVELARKEETRALAFTDEANEQMKLYNLTMKVNRLENLKAQIGLELCGGFSQLEKKYGTFLNEQMMEEFDRQSGILGMTTKRPEAIRRQAEAVVNGSFHNATFSERLWNQQDALKGELDRLLSRALIQGLNPRAVAPELRKKFGASEQAADLLMITELCRVQTEAQKLAFQEYGYDEYTFICNGGACEACEGLSGKHFKVSEMLAGQNAPPMHPRCRCSTAAYIDREKFDKWLDALERGEDVRWSELDLDEEYHRVRTYGKPPEYKRNENIDNFESEEEIKAYFPEIRFLKNFSKLTLDVKKEIAQGFDYMRTQFGEKAMPKICGASEEDDYAVTTGKQGKINFLKNIDINDAFSTACHESIHIYDYNRRMISLDIYDATIKALKKQGYKTNKSIDTLKLDLLGYEYYNRYHKDEPELLAYSFEEYLYGSSNAFVVQVIEELRKRK